jgi:maleate isomerase
MSSTAPIAPPKDSPALPEEISRFGLVALASDLTVEWEFRCMLPADGPRFYVSRVSYQNDCRVETLRAMADLIGDAASLILPGRQLGAIAYGCTSATVAIGPERLAGIIETARPGTPTATPIMGAVAACETLGLNRIAVFTPYIDAVNEPIRDFLGERGIEVDRLTGLGLTSDYDIAAVDEQTITDAAAELNGDDVDGIFLSCTALVSAHLIAPLEQRLGKPVLTSNQCLLWQSLRLSGYTKPIHGFGRLLEI